MNNNSAVDLSCLLCGSDKIAIHHSLSAEDILKCWDQVGHQFSPSVTRPLLDGGAVHLYDCLECGFQFFDPALAGGAEFYEQLHAGEEGYYAPNRSEYTRNAHFAVKRGYRTILDVGCGTGSALDAAKRSGLETFGLELSGTAAAAAAAKGHKIFPVLLEEMDPAWEGKFDLITLNQVLEHVRSPATLVKQCVRFLSPRGAIAVAVPGAGGVLRFSPWLEYNWPPHHLSRWRRKDFHTLARRTDLAVIENGGEPLLGAGMQFCLLGHRQRCLLLGKPYRGFPPFVIKSLCFTYRKTGLKYLFGSQGNSIYCYLGRQTVVSQNPKLAVAL